MPVNRGKPFEQKIRKAFEKVPGVSIDRVTDQTTKYLGSTNICDYIVYKKPYEYYIECKSVHGNTLSIYSIPKPDKKGVLHGFYGNISDAQWEGLLEKSKIEGVVAGVICWWIDKDITKFIPIQALQQLRDAYLKKSIRYDIDNYVPNGLFDHFDLIDLIGEKKRVYFDYDMEDFFKKVSKKDEQKYL